MVVACGSRTALLYETDPAPVPLDGSFDAARPDASLDALPGLDVIPRPDISVGDCPDAADTRVFVVTSQSELYSFYPPTLTFRLIGRLGCDAPVGETPFSMAIDRRGVAYVVYTHGALYQVSTQTAQCARTPFATARAGFRTFGMGFSTEPNGSDVLYVAGHTPGGDSEGLGKIDLSSMALQYIAPFSPSFRRAELTGTGDGRLFAYWPGSTGSFIAEVDKASGRLVAADGLSTGAADDAFAFAFWGGRFWVFHSSGGPTDVTRFDPVDKSSVPVTTVPSTVVGAGVSTCAPR
jgi:hypothetical protein